jgi:hypothetical protein
VSAAKSTSFDSSNGGGNTLFIAAVALVVIGGIAAVVAVASGRESNLGVAPEANLDHWHSAYLISDCGVSLPQTNEFETTDGIHTHGDGLIHVHPFNPSVAGRNATLGSYFEGYGAELTDDAFLSGPADLINVNMSEEAGCDGEPAELQLAVWRNAFDETAEPEIITEGLADFTFETAGMAFTLALVPEGEEAPRPPIDRITQLQSTGPGGPIFGVEEGESPIVTVPIEDDEASEDGSSEGGASADETDSDDGVE